MENHPDAREYERNNGLVGYEELVSRYMGGIWYLVFEWAGFWGGVTSGVLPMLRGNLQVKLTNSSGFPAGHPAVSLIRPA